MPPLTQFPFHQQGLHAESSDGELEAKTGSYHSTHTTGLALMFLFRTGWGQAAIYQRPPDLELRQWWCKLVGLDTSVFTDSVLILCLIVYTRHLLLWFCQNDIEESANRTAASQYF